MRRVPAALGPLASATTYRRGVHMLLGGVLLLPYLLLGAVFARMLAGPPGGRPAAVLLLVAAAAVGAVPAFLRSTRSLEIAAARALLGVDLPDPPPGPPAREARVRGALWYALHLATGGLVATGVLVAVPMALVSVAGWLGVPAEAVEGWWLVAPMLLWLLWGPALAAATLAYHLRRRGDCSACGYAAHPPAAVPGAA